MVNTLVPYAALWYLMYLSLAVSWWLTLPLAVLAGAFLVRVFIIFHDCGHGSFFKSATANHILGAITGVLTFTPFYHWRWEHAIHHASAGDLDRRGTGDVWTLTVQEYLEASRWKRFAYRLARNPVSLVRPGAVVPVSDPAAGALAQGAAAGALLGLLDESGGRDHGGRVDLDFRPQGLSDHSVDGADGGRVGRACGCSTCSINSRAFIGSAGRNGITPRRR